MTKSEKTLLGFIITFLSSTLWPSLPQISLIALAIIALLFVVLTRSSALAAGTLVGFLWASFCGYYYLSWQIDNDLYNNNLIVQGKVVSLLAPLPANSLLGLSKAKDSAKQSSALEQRAIKFNFVIDKIGEQTQIIKPKVRLSWYSPRLSLQQGDSVRLFIRLKPPAGLANPDGFNYQQWLSSKNITALGYVRQSPSNQFISQSSSIRQRSVNLLLEHDLPNIRWILALSYGDRRMLTKDDWGLMQRTGTAHLFAISGMHLGIVFGFTFLIGKGLFFASALHPNVVMSVSFRPHLLMLPCSICVAYAYIAGFEIPVMRALFTMLFWTTLVMFAKHWRMPNVLLILLSSFFIIFPFSILGISFWLSFTVVLVIMLFLWRFKLPANASLVSKFMHTIKLQLFISVITLPLIAFTFSSLPVVSFFANLFMIPLVTFVLVPLCLVAAIIVAIGFDVAIIYWLINTCFEYAFLLLNWLDGGTSQFLGEDWQSALWVKKSMAWLTHPGIILAFFLITLPPWNGKMPLVLSILGVCVIHQNFIEKHAFSENKSHLYAMDVGQGSAIVIKDKNGTMLYDTGGSFAGFSMANSVLLPFFKHENINKLKYFIVSHLDNDHAGGANIIKQHLEIGQALSPQIGCNRQDFLALYPSGVALFLGFEAQILWPLKPISGDENRHSCVIKLHKGEHSILLTGDIEKQSEAQIVAMYKDTNSLNSSILIAPHHGSKTSSTAKFVSAVSPEYVVFTSGNNNRWGFPAQSVVNRYKSVNAKVYVTGQHGRISITITQNDIVVSSYREDEYPRWFFKAR